MGTRDKRVDAYIANAADFAKPILEEVRERVHAACPEVEETVKWRMPSFTYHGILCHMAAFKRHATVGFWKASLITDGGDIAEAMGQLDRLTTVSDLPPKRAFHGFIKRAMELNSSDVTAPRPVKHVPIKAPPTPDDFLAAIKKNAKAFATYSAFSPSARKEYVEWITEAKREETRDRRVRQAVEWMAEGKSRNWKYG